MTRAEILEAARACVCGDREHDYGTPEDSFALIAELWTAYTGHTMTSKDVTIMMALLKIARIKKGDKADSFIDLAGYAACAGEIATKEERNAAADERQEHPIKSEKLCATCMHGWEFCRERMCDACERHNSALDCCSCETIKVGEPCKWYEEAGRSGNA